MKTFKKNGAYLAVLLAVIAIVLLFLGDALTATGNFLGTSLNLEADGFTTIFGKDNSGFDFNLFGFLALLLTVLGAVLSFLPVLPAKFRFALAGLLMIVGGIFFFVYPGTLSTQLYTVKAGLPVILSGVFAILGGIVNAGLVFAHN